MKVLKDPEHALLLNYFGLSGRFYLSVTIMTFFAFDDPDKPVSEQELWPFVQKELGKETIFDMAMPKPGGEVLVWGKCYAPDGKPRTASQVTVQVGPISKTLYVFGDRQWRESAAGYRITDPEPFVEMPVTYERAFGGSGFDRNPAGRGIGKVGTPSGREVRPLPNIEDPRFLVGSPGDRPDPAGFGPLDLAWPQRSKKLGTYDKAWLREQWPFYPEDMDWTYFNASPEDQQMDVFFNGAERFVIKNMHQTRPLIESRLPNLRHRVFINQLADKGKPEGETIFKEILAYIDTVWLFPHAERGVIIHRGSVETADDEALDVLHLYVAAEDPSGQPKTIERFHEEFKKRLERKPPESTVAARSMARKKLEEAAEHLKDLPQMITDSFAAGLGQAPVPVRTRAETVANLTAVIGQQEALLDAGEKKLLEAKSRFGHVTKIDVSSFAMVKKDLADIRAQLQSIPGMCEEAAADAAAARAEMKTVYEKAAGRVSPLLLKEKGIDPHIDFETSKPGREQLWHEKGMRFIERCRDNLESRPEYLGILIAMGLRRYTIKRAWLGINPVKEIDDPNLWGLPEEGENRENPRELALPPGLVIPCFDKAKLHRIRIASYRHIYPPPDFSRLSFLAGTKMVRDTAVEGSGDMAMVQGPGEGKPFVRVAYEFEAMLLHQELGGFCTVVVMKHPGILPDKQTAEHMKKAPRFLVLQYPGSEEPADRDIAPWKELHPLAEPLTMPAGANLFEAKKAGVDLWKWVADALGPAVAADVGTRPKDVDAGKPGALAALIPVFDVQGLIKQAKGAMMADMQPGLDRMEIQKKEMTDNARRTLESKGLSTDELSRPLEVSADEQANPFASMKKQYAEQFSETRLHLKQKGVLTPELEKQVSEAERSSSELLAKAAARYEEGSARLAAAEKKLAEGLPAWAKKLLSDAGIDSDGLTGRLAREDVMERHAKGRSLRGENLSGLDLSGLDLRGADLKRANLKKTNMSKCNLDGADLTRVIAQEADFSHAAARAAKMTKGLFRGATFTETDLSGSDLSGVVLNGADLGGANLKDTLLEKALFEKANLKKAVLSAARAMHVNFLSVDASLADFTGANLTKAMFLKSHVDGANFSGAVIRSVHFIETKGKKVNFAGADMYDSRIFNGSAMTESTFTGAKADKACWMKSDMSGSDFRGSSINGALIQECSLAGSDLSGVSAKHARITKTDLSDANLEKLNLLQGSLRKSKLVRTDLRKANLYGAEFYRTGVNDTRFEGANLKMTKLYKRTELLPEKKDKV